MKTLLPFLLLVALAFVIGAFVIDATSALL